ncbi:histidine kinase [Actinoplanes sp. NPDC049118]|uniref:sensor histidine kinase n=1 Tax=Actinoplanes sp. NPDC049118 TaxID=3155769 RepID=UPI0033C00605
MRIPAPLAPLVSGATYRRGVHLLLGAVLLLPYVLLGFGFHRIMTDGDSPGGILLSLGAAVVIGTVPAFLGGTRELEISAARSLLGARLPEPAPAVGRPRPLEPETRIRAALWFALHLLFGGVISALLLLAVPMALTFIGQRFGMPAGPLDELPGPLGADDPWGWTLVGVGLLVVTVYAVAALGALAALMAPVLLGESATELRAAAEARSRRLAERNRLARELHDSVGHALTVTTLQAGAARELFDADPEFARRALAAIEEAGRTAMDDLDYVLGVLRERERERGPAGPLRPQRTLADLDRLRADARAGGLPVRLEVTGPVPAVPAAVSREGYRIVQEGLTNAARHAGRVPVTLRVDVAHGALAIEIVNPVAAEAPTGGGRGRGLDGMRERVGLLRGRLDVGRAGGTWRVAAWLPLGDPEDGA